MDDQLRKLAGLLEARNQVEKQIAELLGRPPGPGNIGEFVASRVFEIKLASTAVQAGYDGWFRSGPLAGATVNVKAYGDAYGRSIQIGVNTSIRTADLISAQLVPRRGARRTPTRHRRATSGVGAVRLRRRGAEHERVHRMALADALDAARERVG